MSTSAVSLLTLERLQQQVDGGSYSVVAACSRIEDLIRNMCKDEMTRPFIGALPKLLSILLGDGATGAVGWIERVSDDSGAHSLWTLLQPTGAVFTAALSYSNGEGFPPFEVSASDLPTPLLKQLTKAGPRSLPLPLDVCLVNVAKEGPPSYALRLDVSEFFVLQLLKLLPIFHRHAMSLSASTPSASSLGIGRRQSSFAFSRSISFESLTIRHGGEKSFRFDHEHSARLYYRLVEAYLQFFLPTRSATASLSRKDGEGTAFSIKSLRTSTGAWTGWRLSSFFFTMLTELWLHRHDYFLKSGGESMNGDEAKVTSEPAFVLPSVDHFEALRRVTQHLVIAVICPVPDHIPSQLVRSYEQLADFAFVPFRLYLYRLLRLCLANCPSDHTVVSLGSLWLDFVAPWRYTNMDLGENPNEQWSAYVGGNYFFYHTLVFSLLEHVESIVESFGMAVGKGTNSQTSAVAPAVTLPLETAQNVLLPLLIVFGRTLSAVGSFVELLKEIETNELDLTGRRGDLASTMGSVHRLGTRSPQGTTQYRIKEQMSALEAESFRLKLLFDGDSTQRALRILYWLEAIYVAIPGALDETKGRTVSGGFRHDNGHPSDYDIHAVIMQCEEELCEIFSIGEQDFLQFSSLFDAAATSRRQPASAGGTSWTRRRKFVTPAMDPDVKIKQKMQIMGGDERVIKSYEIPLMVNLTNALSDLANRQWERLMRLEELSRLPTFIREVRFNFRFLAAYPNLLFIFGVIVSLRVLIWFIRVILF